MTTADRTPVDPAGGADAGGAVVEAGGAVAAVVFDVGGVLVRLGGVERMVDLSGMDSAEAVWDRWLACPWVRRFERGWCTPDEFSAGVVAEWDLTVTPDEFLTEVARWPEGPLPGAAALVAEVASRLPTACLANTNEVHWEVARGFGVVDHCHRQFLSHRIGMVKPDPEVFDHVAVELGTPPGRILFLDDLGTNVAAARERGLRGVRVDGPESARQALVEAGVLAGWPGAADPGLSPTLPNEGGGVRPAGSPRPGAEPG